MLHGKVALVTGAGQGVGRGIALALAKAGASVGVAGRTLEKCQRTVGAIEAEGGKALALECDVTKRDAVNDTVQALLDWGGKLDILVNNAQAARPMVPLATTSDRDLKIAMNTGFDGTVYGMQAAYDHLKQTKGCVINIGSSAGIRGDAGFAAYAAAKEAIRAWSRVAAREWGPDGIRVNVVCPFSDSPGIDYMIANEPEFIPALTAETVLGRLGSSELDVGRTVVFLASEAGAFITGQTINVDGGICIAP
jgi:2-hydroxycyclohexanecarboxyl-CoA dehydrogenase